MKNKKISIFLALLLLVASLSLAQTGEVGAFMGTVRDEQGTPLPGVEVTAHNIQTELTQSTVTNANGRYRIERLPRGLYELTGKLDGFKTTMKKGFELFSGDVLKVDLQLEIGKLEEEIVVLGEAPLIETTRSEVSTIITEKELLSYPQENRNYLHLMQYAPGVQPGAQTASGSAFAVNGMRGESNNYMIDGLNNNDMTDNSLNTTLLPPESIQEFRLITNNFNAEYGRNSGGILNVVMKSGTNELHGSAWGFFRGDSALFRSVDWLSREREPYRRYQYGATLGGPIIKDKTFFYAAFEGTKQDINQVVARFFLTPEAIATATGTAKTFFDRYQSDYPVPTYDFIDKDRDGVADYGRAAHSYTDKFRGYMGALKIDHIFSERDRIAFRWLYNFREDTEGFYYYWTPGSQWVWPSKYHTGGLTWLHIFSPTSYNEVRLGYKRDDLGLEAGNEFPVGIDFYDELYEVGLGDPGYAMTQINNTFQLVDILNIQAKDHNLKFGAEFRYWTVLSSFDGFVNGGYSYTDGLAWLNNSPAGLFFILADPPQNDENPYLLGDPLGEWKTGFGLSSQKWRGYEIGLFAQDDWRISERMTISYGLRWEYYSVPEEYSGAGINQPAFGTEQGFLNNELIEGEWNEEGIRYTIFDGRELMGKGLWNNHYGNFAPKISVAYDLTGDGKTSLRVGYGISYERQLNRTYETDRFNYPGYTQALIFGSPWGGPVDFYATIPASIPQHASLGLNVSLRWMDPNLRPQLAHNWLIGIQREIGPNFSVELDYTGSAGRRIGGPLQFNRFTGDRADGIIDGINPYISTVNSTIRTNSFDSNYHGLQIILNKRFSQGWSWYTAYTFGVSKDGNSRYFQRAALTSIEDWSLDYTFSDYDHRHRIVGGLVWELPLFRDSKNWALKNLVGGWQVGVSFHYTSGRRFSVVGALAYFSDYNLDGVYNDRPLWLGGADYNEAIQWEQGKPNLDPNLFGVPEPPAYERDMSYYDQNLLPRNAFTWHPTYNIDISFQKNFEIPSRNRDFNLQLIMEVFNLLKSQFWVLPRDQWGLADFGDVTRMEGDRMSQVSIRFMF